MSLPITKICNINRLSTANCRRKHRLSRFHMLMRITENERWLTTRKEVEVSVDINCLELIFQLRPITSLGTPVLSVSITAGREDLNVTVPCILLHLTIKFLFTLLPAISSHSHYLCLRDDRFGVYPHHKQLHHAQL